jgi:AP-4 complex subunit epsilon-1
MSFLNGPVGYLFCVEIMPRNHELQLMLVNTLRKVRLALMYWRCLSFYAFLSQDLENSSIPRICLALDILVQSSTEDVVPAVLSRLNDLLSHTSSVGIACWCTCAVFNDMVRLWHPQSAHST